MGTYESLPVALQTYFEHLENGEFEAAAGQLTEDCLCLHPPSYQSEVRVKGQAELVEYFTNARGKQEINHEIIHTLVGDNEVAFIGYQTGDNTGTITSSRSQC